VCRLWLSPSPFSFLLLSLALFSSLECWLFSLLTIDRSLTVVSHPVSLCVCVCSTMASCVLLLAIEWCV